MPWFPCDRCGDVEPVTQLHHELLCQRCRAGRIKADRADARQDRTGRRRRLPRTATVPAAQQEYAG